MKKVPIELLTTSVSAKRNSPVIWDGYDIVLSQNDDYNIQNIFNNLTSLTSKASSLEVKVNSHAQELNRISPNVNMLMQSFPDIRTKMSGIENTINGTNGAINRLVTVEARIADIESDINSIVSGGFSGSGDTGSGVSSVYSSILSALNTGTYLLGGSNISVEKVNDGTSAGAYRINFTGNITRPTITSGNNFINVSTVGNTYSIDFNSTELFNVINASKGLQLDAAFQNKIVIIPKSTLVKGDGSTTNVVYNSSSGEFTVSALGGGGGSGGANIDNDTIISSGGLLSVNKDFSNADIYEFSYLSNNFYGYLELMSSRLLEFNNSSIFSILPTDKISSISSVAANTDLNDLIKNLVFNVNNVSMFDGKFYLISDFNKVGSNVIYSTTPKNLNSFVNRKSCLLEIDFNLKMEFLNLPTNRFGSNFEFTERNLIIPFVIYWVENKTLMQTSILGADVLKYGLPTGDGYGVLLQHNNKILINNSDLSANSLHQGTLQFNAIVGFKVGSSADSDFKSKVSSYLVEPKFKTFITYL